ncbi:succinate-semialdehyde dehydrogenase [Vibrio astriarenae]|nr:succinate-semialdehyde dehydrogenase [Vibrio sp. C7]
MGESKAIELNDDKLLRLNSYINGSWHSSEAQFAVTNPANGKVIADVANAGVIETELAVRSAKQALKHWASKSAVQRSAILKKWYQLMLDHQDDLAKILTLEQGKPLAEAKGEILYGAAFIEWFAEEAKRAYGDTIPSPSTDKRIVVIKQPVGVVGAITPWNFPNAMITRKAGAALAAGCTFVVRPATQTPLSALAVAELATRAGIPAGVFNVVVGIDSRGMGKVLTQHPDIAKFTFTGSTNVGKALINQCSSTVKKVSMELGGNAPFIVFDDADIDAAVAGAVASKYRNAGQTCICTNRILVQQGIAETFTNKFVEAVSKLKVGDGLSPDTDIGPLINADAVSDVETLVNNSVSVGAKVVLGGERMPTATTSIFQLYSPMSRTTCR